ncbi:unnamed protein product [Mytilus edulis]|uniref:Integrase zinc-binding domain-containing protein n=1 Tax=Mytilus edulis TaxID=6550 RepID=A0A8S3S5U9_MYTED|nr:unnamed protein product [Mytilus edulis]
MQELISYLYPVKVVHIAVEPKEPWEKWRVMLMMKCLWQFGVYQLQDDISIQESNWMKGWSLDDFKKEQDDDPDLKTLVNWLQTGGPPSEHDLQLEAQQLITGGIWLDPAEPRILLLLPKSLKEEAMKYCHDCKTAGHFGQAKTIQKLQQRFIWYQMRVGDIVYRIDSASQIGESKKLRAPWQGPYLIVEVLSSVLYKMRTRKSELTIHHDQLKPCLDRNIPPWLKYMRHRLLQDDNDGEPDLFVQETEEGINKDHAGSTGLESFQQFQGSEYFLDITEEIQEIGVEQHSTGLETRYSSDVDLSDRHIVTYLDGVNVFLNNDSIDNLDDTFLIGKEKYPSGNIAVRWMDRTGGRAGRCMDRAGGKAERCMDRAGGRYPAGVRAGIYSSGDKTGRC